jgi:hypothetical protein
MGEFLIRKPTVSVDRNFMLDLHKIYSEYNDLCKDKEMVQVKIEILVLIHVPSRLC